jgi:hypothetical protein
VVAVTAISAAASVLIYWGHFGDVFRLQIDRARAAVSSTAEAGGAPARTRAPADPSAMGERTISLGGRVRMMLDQTLDGVGWPILLLALVGLWRAFADDGGGRLDLAIAGWAIVWLVFISAGVLLPGNKGYQQDAYEFIARVVHAAVPAAVLLAARGATWLWRADARSRAASMALLAWAVVTGVRAWTSWLS